jgi:hypothetical protein
MSPPCRFAKQEISVPDPSDPHVFRPSGSICQVSGIDPDPDTFIIKQNSKENLDSYCIVTSFGLFIFEK